MRTDTKHTIIYHIGAITESAAPGRSTLPIKHQLTAIIMRFSQLQRASPLMDVGQAETFTICCLDFPCPCCFGLGLGMRLERRRSCERRPLGEAAPPLRRLCGLPIEGLDVFEFRGSGEGIPRWRSPRSHGSRIDWSLAQPSSRSRCSFIVSATGGINLREVRPLRSESRGRKKLLGVVNNGGRGSRGFLCRRQPERLRAFFPRTLPLCFTSNRHVGPHVAHVAQRQILLVHLSVTDSPSNRLPSFALPPPGDFSELFARRTCGIASTDFRELSKWL